MNERQILARRRELVLLSARMQRTAIRARLDRLQGNTIPTLASLALRLAGRRWMRAAAIFVFGRTLRRFFRKPGPNASKGESRS